MPLSARQRQTLIWTATAVLLGAVLIALGPVLTPFVAAAVIAYMLAPMVQRLHDLKVPRSLAAVLVIAATLLVLLLLVLILLPIMRAELALVRQKLPALAAALQGSVAPWFEQTFGLKLQLDAQALREWIGRQLADGGDEWGQRMFGYARSGWSMAVEVVGAALLVPLVLFYLLADWPAITRRLRNLVPPRWLPQVTGLLGETDALLGQYLRGQLMVMLALAAYYSIGLLLVGLDLWLPIGVLTGLLVVVPYLGFALGLVLALLSGLMEFGLLKGLATVGSVYAIGQLLETYFLTPRLVGERIGLHPVAVIFALLAFGSLFGFVGVLLALPLAALAAVGLRRLHAAWLASDFYHRS